MKIRPFVDWIAARFGYCIVKRYLGAPNKHPVESSISSACLIEPAVNAPPKECTVECTNKRFSSEEPWVLGAASEFKSKGVCTVKIGRENAIRWRESLQFDGHVGNRHPSWDWAGNPLVPYSQVIKTATPSAAMLADLTAIFSRPSFDAFFCDIMGCPVTAVNCRIVQSTIHEGEGTGPQSWHLDGCPIGVLRGVLYLTDVDENGGPFQYRDSNGETSSMLGEAGDCLVFDARRLEHRALPPKASERKAVDLIFMPRLSGQSFKVNDAGMNTWPLDPFFYDVPKRRIFEDPKCSKALTGDIY